MRWLFFDFKIFQPLAALLLDNVQLVQRRLDILALLAKLTAPIIDAGNEIVELSRLSRVAVIHADHVGNLHERESQPLTAQNQFESYPVAIGIDALASTPFRMQQAFILVKSNGPWSHFKLPGKLADA